MAEPPQGIARWGKVKDFISAQMTFAPGISPSTCKITIPPQQIGGMQSGTLTFEYGGKSWHLYKCRLDSVVSTTDDNGAIVWEMDILDRRWVWQECGRISGFYNAREGGQIRPGTEKRPKAMAELCLRAMGEKRWDLGTFDFDTFDMRPEVDWDYTLPAEALADLCEKTGHLIVLGLDDQVHICRKGSGKPLPSIDYLDGSEVFDPPDPPGKVVVVGGRTRFQQDFKLEAVGLEVDGSIRPIDKLSYAPQYRGMKWSHFDLHGFTGMPEPRDRKLAEATVYRWYRVKTPFFLPGIQGEIKSLDRTLPLEQKQVERWQHEGIVQPRPRWVYGHFYPGDESTNDEEEDKTHPSIKDGAQYTKGFQLDVERGIVQFSQPVYRLVDDNSTVAGKYMIPADLRLRTACSLRDADTLGWVREEWAAVPPVKSSVLKSIRYIMHEDVVVEWHVEMGRMGGWKNNLRAATREADKRLAAAMLEYQPKDSASMTYPGLHEIEPDGAILQVSWVIASNGRATTRVSRNREESHIAPGQQEMRVFERLFREFREKQKPDRQRAEDFFRRRAPL